MIRQHLSEGNLYKFLLFRVLFFYEMKGEMMEKYQNLVNFILKNIGGKENVLSVTHCMTRLRFTLKDNSLVNEKELLKSNEIMTAQFSAGRYQVVIGTTVADVFKVVQKTLSLEKESEQVKEKKGAVNSFIEIVTKVITPVLGILTAAGLLQGILALLTVLHVLDVTDGAYIIFHAMGQTAFYFLPVILGYTSAKAFKLNPFVGMILGATLVIPELATNLSGGELMYTMFSGTIFETPVYNTFFGIPILFPSSGYQYSVIPIILITYIGSKVERVVKKVVPGVLAHNLNSFLTIFITVPLSILIIGPITNVISSLLTAGVSSLYIFSPHITSVVVALLYQPLVIFGLHWPISAIGINNLAQMGSDYIFPMSFTANFAQTAVVLAVFLRTKSKEQKALAVPAMVSGTFCIIEPAIYGFSLPVKKRFAFSMLGGAAGSLIIALCSAKMYAFSFGILGFVSFINPENGSVRGVVVAVIATIVTMLISFLLTYFTYKEDEDPKTEVNTDEKPLLRFEKITSPMDGKIKPLDMCTDNTFASKTLGEGIVIVPENGKLVSPVSGKINTIFPDGHALGIISDSGMEILIHVGMNTVEMKENPFIIHIEQGQNIKQGDLILEADLGKISENGFSSETVMIVTNSDRYLNIISEKEKDIHIGDKVLTVIPFSETAGKN